MCVCGWQLVAVAVAMQLMAIAYGDIEGRRRSDADWLALRCRLADFTRVRRDEANVQAEHCSAARKST
jgi:hypothetical protein